MQIDRQAETFAIDTSKINLLYDISWETAFTGDSLHAVTYAYQALAISQKINWKKGTGLSYNAMQRVYDYKRNDSLRLYYCKKALSVFAEINYDKGVASSYADMGDVYLHAGNYPAALDNFFQALRVDEKAGDKYETGRDLTNIGAVYLEIDDNINALNYTLRALEIHKEFKDKYWQAINMEDIASIYNDEGNYNKALEFYMDVLGMEKGDVYSSYETFKDIANVYRNLSAQLSPRNDTAWQKSMDYYSRSFAAADQMEDHLIAGLDLTGMGALYLGRKKLPDARTHLIKAEKYLLESMDPPALADCYLNLSRLDSLQGDWKNSFRYFRLYETINDSLFNKKKSRELAQVLINYETEKKQNQIEILNKDNEVKDLRIAQQSKNILLIVLASIIILLSGGGMFYYRNRRAKQLSLKQISEAKLASLKSLMDKHFIFSSLHSIDTFLMNNDAEAASNYLVKYSKLIRSILEMSNQPEVSLEEEVTLCRSYLDLEKIRYNYAFDYEFSIDPGISWQQTQFPSMLLQPLVENAVKHGVGSLSGEVNKKKGMIKVAINKEDDKLVCTVSDNGKGLQFSGEKRKDHRSYSGKGIAERVKVYNNLRKNKASFILKDNSPGVTATLTLPYIFRKQSLSA